MRHRAGDVGKSRIWQLLKHQSRLCERCGRTAEVDACGLEESLRNLESLSGFKIMRHQLMLFGLCGDCHAEPGAGAEGHRSKTGPKGGPQEVGREIHR